MSERDVSHYVGRDLDQSVGSRSMSIVPRIDMLQITTPSQPQQQQQQQQQQQEIAFDGLSSRCTLTNLTTPNPTTATFTPYFL